MLVGMLMMLIVALADCLLLTFTPSSMSSPRETLDVTVLHGLQYRKHDKQCIILNKMELYPQNLKATATRIPIPESNHKFFNQLPI